jgi:hypothetical protein
MRIISAKGEFVLPAGWSAPLSKNNPFLSDSGDKSQPITLPGTPHNLELIGFSHRIDSYYKPLTDLPVIVQSGLWSKRANLGIHSANEDEGISATIYFGTSDFYSVISETTLQTLQWPTLQNPDPQADLNEMHTWLIDYLKTNSGGSEFVVCPIATSQKLTYRINRNPWGANTPEDVECVFILNWFEQYKRYLDFETGGDHLTVYQAEYAQQIVENGNVINITPGYGMTPFLKLHYVLNQIFTHFGYSFDGRSIEDEIQAYMGIFVINNVADAIYSGVLRYGQLLPEVTIKQFISEIEKWLCGKFIIEDNRKMAWFEFFKNQSRYNYQNMTPYLAGKVIPKGAEFVKKVINLNGELNETEGDNVEKIEFNFKEKANIEAEFMWTSPNSIGYSVYSFEMLFIDSVVHKNSAVIVNGETKTDGEDGMKEIWLGYSDGSWQSTTKTGTVLYKTSKTIFSNMRNTLHYLYEDYIRFYEHSNIPFTVKLKIPEDILANLRSYSLVLIDNQPALIEKIDWDPKDTIQSGSFRTYRSYH